MPAAACFVRTDLSEVTLVQDGRADVWRAPLPQPEEARGAGDLRLQTKDAARWIARHEFIRRRLAFACLDVDEALFSWIAAPSDASPVIAATQRSRTQEWGDVLTATAIEPVADVRLHAAGGSGNMPLLPSWWPGRKDRAAAAEEGAQFERDVSGGVRLGVINFPDALVRLWLDELDRAGVKVGAITSLWHTLCRAWAAQEQEPTGVILIEEDSRLVWSWSRAGDLLAGGTVNLRHPRRHAHEPSEEEPVDGSISWNHALHRLLLDWLTWGSQLGLSPNTVIIVGDKPQELAEALRSRWPETEFQTMQVRAPIEETISRAAEQEPLTGRSARRALTRLSNRPTRQLRRKYQMIGAAILLLALAVAALGYRLASTSARWQQRAALVISEARDKAVEFDARVVNAVDPVRRLEEIFIEMSGKEPLKPPPEPKPIYSEFVRVLDILMQHDQAQPPESDQETTESTESEDARVELLEFQLADSSPGCELRIEVANRRTQEDIEFDLFKDTSAVNWIRARGSAGSPLIRFTGNFR